MPPMRDKPRAMLIGRQGFFGSSAGRRTAEAISGLRCHVGAASDHAPGFFAVTIADGFPPLGCRAGWWSSLAGVDAFRGGVLPWMSPAGGWAT